MGEGEGGGCGVRFSFFLYRYYIEQSVGAVLDLSGLGMWN